MLTQRLLGVRNPVGMLEILPQSATRIECTGNLTKIARNNMRAMKKGDLAFFYHSNCKKPGIVGIMEIVQEHSVDGQRYGKRVPVSDSSRSIFTNDPSTTESAFDPNHPYYDGKSTRENPKWNVVHVEFRRKFDEIISLDKLKTFAKSGGALENLQTLRMSRLSVSAVTPNEWDFILGQVQSQNEDDE
jgi:predicted RNA-binding protein with PUA-like domain